MSQQVNLFNPIFMKQRKYFSLLTMLQSLALIVLGSFLFYGYARYQVSTLEQQAIKNNERYMADRVRVEKFRSEFSPEQTNRALQDEIQLLEKKFTEQSVLVSTLQTGVIGNTMGYSQYMKAFSRQVVPGLWLTGFELTGDGAQINLQGAVVDGKLLPNFISRLSHEKSMQGKTFATLEMEQVKSLASKDGKIAPMPRYVSFSLQSSKASEATK